MTMRKKSATEIAISRIQNMSLEELAQNANKDCKDCYGTGRLGFRIDPKTNQKRVMVCDCVVFNVIHKIEAELANSSDDISNSEWTFSEFLREMRRKYGEALIEWQGNYSVDLQKTNIPPSEVSRDIKKLKSLRKNENI